jgi:hypothetical protein
MGFFSKILEKLGIKKDKPAETAASAAAKPAAGFATPTSSAKQVAAGRDKDDVVQKAAPVAISEVDVVANLEKMAAANPAQLNWKVSIVDLLKLLDLDSSFDSRKELATELGCPAEMMNDSAKMNTWLHKEVLRQIAANGGNIPKELLD